MDLLHITHKPKHKSPSLIIGLTEWMNGGEVSTGTVNYFLDKFEAKEFAHLESEAFYVYNYPGSMDMASLFRPHVKIEEGLVKEYIPPENVFFSDIEHDLIFFAGKEPHMNWQAYEDCIFEICELYKVKHVFFIGSVAGVTPHTREPHITYSTSSRKIKMQLKKLGIKPVNYEGPASIVNTLSLRAAEEKIDMAILVAEIPAYIEGYNPRCVETAIRLLGRLLNLKLDIEDLKDASEEFVRKIDEQVEKEPDLAEKIKQLEGDYDSEAFDREMSGLKAWLGKHGLRAD